MADRVAASFASLGLMTRLCENLKAMRIQRPTNIQKLAIPALLASDKNHLIAAETGKGKTLCYLLPLLHRLKLSAILNRGMLKTASSPSALILVSSQTQAQYISNLLKALAKDLNIRSSAIQSSDSQTTISQKLSEGVELLIGSADVPAIKEIDLSSTRELVIDDAELVLGEERAREVAKRARGSRAVLAATNSGKTSVLFKEAQDNQELPELVRIEETASYSDLSTIKHTHISTTAQTRDADFLSAFTHRRLLITQGKALVFCPSLQRVKAIELLLRSNSFSAAPIHSDLSAKTRERNVWKVAKGYCKVLVANDFSIKDVQVPNVKLVASWSFPKDAKEYAYRAEFALRSKATFLTFFDEQEKAALAECKRALHLDKPKMAPKPLASAEAEK